MPDPPVSYSFTGAFHMEGLRGGPSLELQPARMPGTLWPGAQLFVGDQEGQPGIESLGFLQQSHCDGEEVPEGSRRGLMMSDGLSVQRGQTKIWGSGNKAWMCVPLKWAVGPCKKPANEFEETDFLGQQQYIYI